MVFGEFLRGIAHDFHAMEKQSWRILQGQNAAKL
jgi:hypothetical protein